MMMRPSVGSISFSSSFTSVDLPEPDAPTMNTKSPFSITNETSFSAVTSGSYTFVTFLEHDHRARRRYGTRGARGFWLYLKIG